MEYYKKYRVIQNAGLAASINQLIRFFHKLPLIGRTTGDKYRLFALKKFVYILGPVFSVLFQAIKSFMSMIFALILTGFIIWLIKTPGAPADNRYVQFMELAKGNLAFLSFYLTPALLSDGIAGNKVLMYKLNYQYKLEAKESGLINGVFGPLRIGIGRFFPFMIFLGSQRALLLTFILAFIRVIAASINLKRSERKGKGLSDKFWFVLLLEVVLFAILMRVENISVQILLPVFALTLAGFVFSLKFLLAYDKYDRLLEVAKREKDNIELDLDKISNDSLALKEADLTRESTVGVYGYEFLNSVFFARHKRLIGKPILKKAIIIFLVVSLGLGAIKFIFPDSISVLKSVFLAAVPIVAMLFFNDSSSIRAFFLNCDRSLMQYGFYRDEEAVFKMYKLRYKALLKINIPGLLGGLGIIAIYFGLFDNTNTDLAILAAGFILACYLFYPGLILANYYIFQPFNYEAQAIGGMYKLIVSLLGYVNILFIPLFIGKFKLDPKLGVGVLLALTLVLLLVFPILVKIFSKNTFKIRT